MWHGYQKSKWLRFLTNNGVYRDPRRRVENIQSLMDLIYREVQIGTSDVADVPKHGGIVPRTPNKKYIGRLGHYVHHDWINKLSGWNHIGPPKTQEETVGRWRGE